MAGAAEYPLSARTAPLPRDRSGSTASSRSFASTESNPLAALVSSFPVPPVIEEDTLIRLEEALRFGIPRDLFDLPPPPLGPPPDCPLPPLPSSSPPPSASALRSPPCSSSRREHKLGLPLTYTSPLGSTVSHLAHAPNSPSPPPTPTPRKRPSGSPPAPFFPPPSIPLPRLPKTSTTPHQRSDSDELEAVLFSPVDWTARGDTGRAESRAVSPRDSTALGFLPRPAARAQSDPPTVVHDIEEALVLRALPPGRRRYQRDLARQDPIRSSCELETIKADLSQLLDSFKPRDTVVASSSSVSASTTQVQADTSPDSSNRSTRNVDSMRKSSAASVYSSMSGGSGSSSSQANTTGGYKAYKLVRKQTSFANLSPSASRRGSSSAVSLAESDEFSSGSDSEELFDLSLDTPSTSPALSRKSETIMPCLGRPRRPCSTTAPESEHQDGVARHRLQAFRSTGSLRRSSPPTPIGPGTRILNRQLSHDVFAALAPVAEPKDEESIAAASESPPKQAAMKPLMTAPIAQSSYLPSSLRATAHSQSPVAKPDVSPRTSMLPRTPPAPRALFARSPASSSRLPRPQAGFQGEVNGKHARKQSALASLNYRTSETATTT
ncbi:hypothetical protein JCM10908_006355 [Rhodotorula pacifica]|uniref:uncharacterized protein n=1 Tax=Rhodotorula pacifica TaxID=1495444 RepID=UPI00317B562A